MEPKLTIGYVFKVQSPDRFYKIIDIDHEGLFTIQYSGPNEPREIVEKATAKQLSEVSWYIPATQAEVVLYVK